MDHPIFVVLAKMIQKPTRNLDWFQMAEHIINTVYALGVDPAQWAEKVLQSLAKKAFTLQGSTDEDHDMADDSGDVVTSMSQTPSTQIPQNVENDKGSTDTFRLSQLLSVVGHVGLKQLVFLETVERDWKRQKDEKLAGKWDKFEIESAQMFHAEFRREESEREQVFEG